MTDNPTPTTLSGEAAFLHNMKTLGTLLIPEDEIRRAEWYQTFHTRWLADRQKYLNSQGEIDADWTPPDNLAASYLEKTMPHNLAGTPFFNELKKLNWFALDWKDAETSIDFLNCLQERYQFTPLQWSVLNPIDDLDIEAQCREANVQLLPQGFQLWNIDVGGDVYLLLFLTENHVETFLHLAMCLNLDVQRFEPEPSPAPSQPDHETQADQTEPVSYTPWQIVFSWCILLLGCYSLYKVIRWLLA